MMLFRIFGDNSLMFQLLQNSVHTEPRTVQRLNGALSVKGLGVHKSLEGSARTADPD